MTGAIWTDLVPTVIALAVYFCIADFVLISQFFYYNNINAHAQRHQSVASATFEEEPLLARRRSSDTIGLPGSHRRRSFARSGHRRDSLSNILQEDDSPNNNPWLRNTISILALIVAGSASGMSGLN
jgi:hypothetical protein